MFGRTETLRFYRKHLPHWEVADGRYFVTIRLKGAIPKEGLERIEAFHAQLETAVKNGQDGLRESRVVFREMEHWLHRAERVTHLRNPQVAKMIEEAIRHREQEGIWRMFSYVIMPNHLHLFFGLGGGCSSTAPPVECGCVGSSTAPPVECGLNDLPDHGRRREPTERTTKTPDHGRRREPTERTTKTPDHGRRREPTVDLALDTVLTPFKHWTGHRAKELLGLEKRDFWQREWFDHWSRSPEEDEKIVDYIRENPVNAGLVRDWREWSWVR
jgi:REP element-mobilizing transposase RayT